ncbi:MAG TPA: ADP-ribosylglycohydrolase family protein [Kofleriaceae bacterium]|nr:ADP-ribosylglycohydrolase family protein [Kofleriaceae bacterium]
MLDRIRGCLLGTALGDAAGLPYEGLSPARVARALGDAPPRPRALVSDDTEQTALVASGLACTRDPDRFGDEMVRRLRRWFLALPPAIGWGTLRACVKLCLGGRRGVASAGNAPAMRAAVIGVVATDDAHLDALCAAATTPTHTDARAVDAARVVARAARGPVALDALAAGCRTGALAAAITRIAPHVGEPPAAVVRALGWTRGPGAYCVETVPAALWACASAATPAGAIEAAIRLGGDTDTIAAIAGAIAGARTPHLLDAQAVDRLGRTRAWLERLAVAVAERTPPPRRRHPLAVVPANVAVGVLFIGYAVRHLALSASPSRSESSG